MLVAIVSVDGMKKKIYHTVNYGKTEGTKAYDENKQFVRWLPEGLTKRAWSYVKGEYLRLFDHPDDAEWHAEEKAQKQYQQNLSKAEYTVGKWRVKYGDNGTKFIVRECDENQKIATIKLHGDQATQEANLQRIIDCINAMVFIPDPLPVSEYWHVQRQHEETKQKERLSDRAANQTI